MLSRKQVAENQSSGIVPYMTATRVERFNLRGSISWILVSIALIASMGCASNFGSSSSAADQGNASSDSRPNFLVITSDDMGYTDLGAFGGHDIATPNLDQLAREGVRLTNFHAAPSCAPTRASMMTGSGNHEAGLGTQIAAEGLEGWGYERFLQGRVATLPEMLQAGGYHTVMSGKWHIGSGDPTGGTLPRDRGFDRDFALLTGANSHYDSVYQSEFAYSDDGALVAALPEGVFSTTAYVDRLISFLDDYQESDQPFFAWFAPTAPHWPAMYPPGWEGRYSGAYDAGYGQLCRQRMADAAEQGVLPLNVDIVRCATDETPWEELDPQEQRSQAQPMEIYAAMTEHLDLETGRLLAYMEEAGFLENTWIIYFNDNGPQGGGNGIRTVGDLDRGVVDNSMENLGRPDSWTFIETGWADAISSPFRDLKASQYEGGIRVPAFVWHANYHTPGEVDSQYLHVMDIMPTLLDFAGINPPRGEFDGREVLPLRGVTFAPPLLGSPTAARAQDDFLALSSAGKSFAQQGDWKLTYHAETGWELFNLTSDPGERNNLRDIEPDRFAQMRAEFERVAKERNYQHPR